MLKTQFKLVAILLLLGLSSCVSKKKILYFQDDATIVENVQQFALKFKKDDLLTINVSSKNLETVKAYNLPVVAYNAATNTVNGIPKQQSYLIDANGEIQFPVLGKIKLEGLTRVEAIKLLEQKIRTSVTDATVNIQILNFKINVMGDVKNPGMFPIQNERVTVLDALAMAGDTNISGERIIEVKRETPKGVVTGYIDLRSNQLFASPFYYLQQNDVVYVNPNSAKIQSASYNQNTGLFISITSVLISLISILTR
ncbi:MAG: polysaccharide biosynthesis/export family protein [Flavobacteriaceae bacterium]|nr:polysaccharide biosynthesis/export family protein [Flavobacteriaceae bacterium]